MYAEIIFTVRIRNWRKSSM